MNEVSMFSNASFRKFDFFRGRNISEFKFVLFARSRICHAVRLKFLRMKRVSVVNFQVFWSVWNWLFGKFGRFLEVSVILLALLSLSTY